MAWMVAALFLPASLPLTMGYIENVGFNLRVLAVKNMLKQKYFQKGLDLGAGEGAMAPYIKPHLNYLIGVDWNEAYLQAAAKTNLYQELLTSDLKTFLPAADIDIVFLIEVIEHLEKQDGEKLLSNLTTVPNIVITTPKYYFRNVRFGGPHLSLWTPQDFNKFGLEAYYADFLHVVATKFS